MNFREKFQFRTLEAPGIDTREIATVLVDWLKDPQIKSLNDKIREISNHDLWLSEFVFDVSIPKFKIVDNAKR